MCIASWWNPTPNLGRSSMPILQRYYPTDWRSENCFPAFSLNSRKIHHNLPLPLTCMSMQSEAAPTTKLVNRHSFFEIDRCPTPRPPHMHILAGFKVEEMESRQL